MFDIKMHISITSVNTEDQHAQTQAYYGRYLNETTSGSEGLKSIRFKKCQKTACTKLWYVFGYIPRKMCRRFPTAQNKILLSLKMS